MLLVVVDQNIQMTCKGSKVTLCMIEANTADHEHVLALMRHMMVDSAIQSL